ncbi:MAG TPA: hypothetical protein VF267_11735, partial [Gammaproteobacteria bacterium]
GIAGLTIGALKDTRGAFNRTKAVAFAWDMAERIRANATAGSAYEVAESASGTDGSCFATESNATPSSCDAGTLAAHDIFEWKTALADTERGLPSGVGSIDFDNSTSPPTYTITVEWSDGIVTPSDANPPAVTLVTQL